MKTHVVYDNETGEIVQLHTEYSVEEDDEIRVDDQEVLSNVGSEIDRSRLSVAYTTLDGLPSPEESGLEVDVETGELQRTSVDDESTDGDS